MNKLAKFKFDRYNEVICTVIKPSLYFQESMISYVDPKWGGISYEWVDNRRIVHDKSRAK